MKNNLCFKALASEIKHNPFLEIRIFEFGEPVEDKILVSGLLASLNLKLASGFEEVYGQLTSLKIAWKCDLSAHPALEKYDAEDEIISGEINILPLEIMGVFDAQLRGNHWVGSFEDEELEDLESFRSIDIHDEFIRIGFLLENNVLAEDVYYIKSGTTGFGLAPFSLSEYFQRMFKYKGFSGWQYNILFPDTDNAARMEHYIKQLF